MKWALAAMLALPLLACGQGKGIEIENAWMRDTVGRTANAAVFMTITSPVADRLLSAATPVAGRTDLMTMTAGDNAMAMTYVDAIDIPPGEPVRLDPSGLHVWLEDLEQPLAAGQTFPLSLEFETAGEQEVVVTIIAPAEAPPASAM